MRAAGQNLTPPAEVNQTTAEAIRAFEKAEAEGNRSPASNLGGRLRAVRLMGKLALPTSKMAAADPTFLPCQ
jgi:hypothetical protein